MEPRDIDGDLTEILIEESVSETAARIREQRINGATELLNRSHEFINAFERRQIGNDRRHGRTISSQRLSRGINFRFISGDYEIETVLSALTRQLQPDSGGCASHNSERTTLSIHGEDSIRVLMISVDVINER